MAKCTTFQNSLTNILEETKSSSPKAKQDATEAFEDVGHSDEARALLPGMLVGEFEKGSNIKLKSGAAAAQESRVEGAVEQGSNLMYFVPLGLLGAYFAWRYYSTGSA